jgi:hypothetical protein
MKKLLPALALLLAGTVSGRADEDKAGPKDNTPPEFFQLLFNGKDRAGWRTDDKTKDHWKVVDGILVYDGKDKNLRTEKEYRHFVLHVDWKIAPRGGSGIFLRGRPQVQIWDSPEGSGGLWNDLEPATGKRNTPLKVMDHKPGEWNHFEIRLDRGDVVTVFLNGERVVDNFRMKGGSKELPMRGPIELQHHGTPLWFKNIYIRELADD